MIFLGRQVFARLGNSKMVGFGPRNFGALAVIERVTRNGSGTVKVHAGVKRSWLELLRPDEGCCGPNVDEPGCAIPGAPMISRA